MTYISYEKWYYYDVYIIWVFIIMTNTSYIYEAIHKIIGLFL